jgi:hypothetical protein
MYQHSIDTGELPQEWLNASISCIYKKGDKHAAENYHYFGFLFAVGDQLNSLF